MHITQKGQVTIPRKIREKYGITPSIEIEFTDEGGKITLIKQSARAHPLDKLVGILKNPQRTDKLIRKLRGKI